MASTKPSNRMAKGISKLLKLLDLSLRQSTKLSNSYNTLVLVVLYVTHSVAQLILNSKRDRSTCVSLTLLKAKLYRGSANAWIRNSRFLEEAVCCQANRKETDFCTYS